MPWGRALNVSGPGATHVRTFFEDNALHWLHEYHVDGLRLDATHAFVDDPAEPFVRSLVEAVRVRGPQRGGLMIAEDETISISARKSDEVLPQPIAAPRSRVR